MQFFRSYTKIHITKIHIYETPCKKQSFQILNDSHFLLAGNSWNNMII